VLEAALRLIASDLAQRGRVVRELAEVPPVIGSAARLGQVFLNLLVNAVQALPEGRGARGEIRVCTRCEGEQVVVSVTDTGVGIPEHLVGRVFEPFFSTKPVGSGAGLGLSISHGIVRAMGGTLEVESQVGRGTTAFVRLPAGAAVAPVAPAPGPGRPSSVRRRVLLIDDEPSLLRALARALGDRHQVDVAVGGKEALELIQRGTHYDAVLCDLHMPDVSGKDVHAFLARHQPALAARLVFVTGGAFTEEIRRFIQDTQNPVLEKPLDLARVEAVLGQMFGEHASA
jgi:CheY-like chemotaxis protein